MPPNARLKMPCKNMSANLRTLALTLLLALPLGASAAAPAVTAPATITFDKLSIAITPGAHAVAFPTVTSTRDDAITGADSACCTAVELHTHEMDGDIMRMRRVEQVALKADTPTLFEPQGLHVMLIGLKSPLKAGDSIPVTFHFLHAADQTVTFTARGR